MLAEIRSANQAPLANKPGDSDRQKLFQPRALPQDLGDQNQENMDVVWQPQFRGRSCSPNSPATETSSPLHNPSAPHPVSLIATACPDPATSSSRTPNPAPPTITLQHRQQSQILPADAYHPPETDPDLISHLWASVARFNAFYLSIDHPVESTTTPSTLSSPKNNSQVAHGQQCLCVVESEPEA